MNGKQHIAAAMISIHAPRTGSDGLLVEVLKCIEYFNPRSPHGERQAADYGNKAIKPISIHAPRTGSDIHVTRWDMPVLISIHAPRTGSDVTLRLFAIIFDGISIHAPRTGSDYVGIAG